MQVANSTGKISDISNAITTEVSRQCQCQYTAGFIVNSRLLCSDGKSETIYQGQLVTTDGKTADQIRNLTQEWVLTKPYIKVGNKMYQLDPYCSVAIEELGDTTCDAISPTESRSVDTSYSFTTLEVASVAIMAVLFMVVVTACTIIVCLVVKVRNSKR